MAPRQPSHTYIGWLSGNPPSGFLKRLVDEAKEIMPDLHQLHHHVRWDFVVVLNMKEGDGYMSDKKIVPNPTEGFPSWAAAMSTCPNSVNLRDYRDLDVPDKRLWLMEGARHITQGMKHRVLKAELVTISDAKVNCFEMTEEAKEFWKNGRDQEMTDQQICDGWEAMMSIKEDDKEE